MRLQARLSHDGHLCRATRHHGRYDKAQIWLPRGFLSANDCKVTAVSGSRRVVASGV